VTYVSIDLKSQNLKKAMAALMIGVVAGVIAIFAERADTLFTGGNFNTLGYINTYTWILVSAVLFGFIGAIITTEIQALIGLITASSPLSPLWPIINLLFALGVGAAAFAFTRFRPQAKLSTKLLTMSTICAILDIPLVYVVMVMALGLPYIVYLGALPIYIVLQLIPSTILAYLLVRTLKRSKVIP
jgi:heme A synthase